MPSTVVQITKKLGLLNIQKVKWFENISSENESIYIISLTNDPNLNNNTFKIAPISEQIIIHWLGKAGGFFELDNVKTNNSQKIINRLSQIWLADENILYINQMLNNL